MKSLLIKDTTEAERANIVAESLEIIDGQCDGCSSGLADMYDDYIYGKRELAEINASFRANYVKGDDDRDDKGSCMMRSLPVYARCRSLPVYVTYVLMMMHYIFYDSRKCSVMEKITMGTCDFFL